MLIPIEVIWEKISIEISTHLEVLQHEPSKAILVDTLVDVNSQLSRAQEFPKGHIPHHHDNNFPP